MIPVRAGSGRFKIRGSAVDSRSAAVADSNPIDTRRICSRGRSNKAIDCPAEKLSQTLLALGIIVIKRLRCGIGVRRIAEPVSDPRFCQNVSRMSWIVLDLLPEHLYVGPQVLWLVAVLGSPNRSQNLCVC